MPQSVIKNRYYTLLLKFYRRLPFRLPFFSAWLRLIMRHYFSLDKKRIDYLSRRQQPQIADWFEHHQIFFGLSASRSGSNFLAHLLSQQVDKTIIVHEINHHDYWASWQALKDSHLAGEYIRSYRLKEIYFRCQTYPDFAVYGEVNPFLRYHAAALKKFIPQAKFFHLIRDGRSYVRSNMSRATFDKKDPLADLIAPPKDSAYFKDWPHLSRFERVCWLWQHDNQYLRRTIGHTLNLEKLISDYGYFKNKLLDYLSIDIPQTVWQAHVRQPRNTTPVYKFPAWPDWTPEQKRTFNRICGQEMKKNGYDLSDY